MADIYKRKRAKYSFEIYIGECTISLQGSILNHGLSLLRSSFRKGYIRNSSLRIWNMAKRRGRGDPRFPRRKIETREHLRLIAPLPDQSSIFPVADQIRTISRFISQLFSVRLTKVCLSFSFFSLSLQVEAWFLSSLHFNLVALGSSYGKIINEKEKWWIWLVVVEGDTRSSRLNYAGC